MIVLGTTGVTYPKGRGSFHCPACARERAYRKKRMRRFFTVYFVPLIPLDLIAEFIECSACHGRFKIEVLDALPRTMVGQPTESAGGCSDPPGPRAVAG